MTTKQHHGGINPRTRTKHPFAPIFRAMWTDEVISAYKAKTDMLQAVMAPTPETL